MPVVFREWGARFFFFSNEGNPREPAHVLKGEGEAKFGCNQTWCWRIPMVSAGAI